MSHRSLPLPLLAGLILCLLGSGPAGADLVAVPGTKVRLEPPAGFLPADKFPGFERAEHKASIMVTEMRAPAAEVMKAMTAEGLASRGMTLLSSRTETLDGREALLVHTSQTFVDTEFLKWMLVTGDPRNCLIVVGTFPKSMEGEMSEAIRRSVLTATWKPDRGASIFQGLVSPEREAEMLPEPRRVTASFRRPGSTRPRVV